MPINVLHVVNTALPSIQNGYTLRTKGIIAGQLKAGLKPKVITADFYRRGSQAHDQHLGVMHLRCTYPADGLLGRLDDGDDGPWSTAGRQFWLMGQFRKKVEAAASAFGDVIHAHSPWWCGLAAALAGRRLGIPVVYEVRGLAAESAIADGRWIRGELLHRFCRAGETLAMRSADAVLPICQGLLDEVEKRCSPNFVRTVPNCVDPAAFPVRYLARQIACKAALGFVQNEMVVGYFGSIRPLEGVEELLRAFPKVLAEHQNARLLIVGYGQLHPLEELAKALGVFEKVKFVDTISHDKMPDFYAALDVFALTRPDTEVTRMVTPLKPLEALASGVPVVASRLPAMLEVLEPGRFYEPGDLSDLAGHINALLDMSHEQRKKIGLEGRRLVCQNRTWDWLGERYRQIYEELGIVDGRGEHHRQSRPSGLGRGARTPSAAFSALRSQ